MAKVTHPQPVNAAQVVQALGSEGCTVRNNDADGTCEVEVPDVTVGALTAALAAIVYDPNVTGLLP